MSTPIDMPKGTHLSTATGIPTRTVQRHLKGDVKVTAGHLLAYCTAVVAEDQQAGPVWELVEHFARLEEVE